jgi:excisionase family DNA binding protein
MRNGQQPGDVAPIRRDKNSAVAIPNTIPFSQRLTCTIAEACEATGLGRTKLYELIDERCLETTMVGRRRLVLVRSLLALLIRDDG